ncbi:hypothetical protein ACLK1Y_20785 [Escherichia coli]
MPFSFQAITALAAFAHPGHVVDYAPGDCAVAALFSLEIFWAFGEMMDNLNLNKHISGQFNAELESIRTQVDDADGGMVQSSAPRDYRHAQPG